MANKCSRLLLTDLGLKEVEAESVAFIVAAVHGMDSGGYSFPYVASWAGADAAAAVAATQGRVARAAREVIAGSPAPHHDGGRAPVAGAERSPWKATAGAQGVGRDASRAHLPSDFHNMGLAGQGLGL
jgi:hypothetical protein